MSAPTEMAWAMAKRLAKYLNHTRKYAHRLALLEQPTHLDVYSDADWAGCNQSARSSTGVVVRASGLVFTCLSQTQPGLPALSSAESELRAISKAAQEGIYVNEVMKSTGIDLPMRNWTDSSAGRAAARRLGCGRMRHLDAGALFIQGLVEQKRTTV